MLSDISNWWNWFVFFLKNLNTFSIFNRNELCNIPRCYLAIIDTRREPPLHSWTTFLTFSSFYSIRWRIQYIAFTIFNHHQSRLVESSFTYYRNEFVKWIAAILVPQRRRLWEGDNTLNSSRGIVVLPLLLFRTCLIFHSTWHCSPALALTGLLIIECDSWCDVSLFSQANDHCYFFIAVVTCLTAGVSWNELLFSFIGYLLTNEDIRLILSSLIVYSSLVAHSVRRCDYFK